MQPEEIYLKSTYFYDLPKELIAQSPAEKRDQSRLMVVHPDGRLEHRHFVDIIEYLKPGDALVLNESRVIPARLYGKKTTGAMCEVLLLKQLATDTWEALVRPGNKLHPGHQIVFSEELSADILDRTDAGGRILKMNFQGNFFEILDRIGQMPLPPYIRKRDNDPSRYQTVYAKTPGSAAAPTAGLHFTPQLLEQIQQKGVFIEKVLLHVGLGTFRPVDENDIRDHQMHSEWFCMPNAVAEKLNDVRTHGGRIIAVGTTSVRVLESCADETGKILPKTGETEIFIYPGYQFRAVDAMITNFHLPESTLLMLVCAFRRKENMMHAYRCAVEEKYRFFSFGDCQLLL